MKSSGFVLPLIISILFFLISTTTSGSTRKNFIECLNDNSSSISELIYTPEDTLFKSILQASIKNKRFSTPETPKPKAIITVKDLSHISATIVCAKQSGLQIRTRSGGHDYEGLSYLSYVPFIIIDLFNYREISIDIETEMAWVQTGAVVGELYYKISDKSDVLGFPAGIFPTIGTGGHFSGGGYGTMMRKYGLTVDNIIDARLVDGNGKILDRESMGEDIFWAIRGGGGASFGVIASWKIQLVPVPKTVIVFKVKRTIEQGATEIVYQWQHVAPKIDRNLFLRPTIKVVNGTHGRKTVQFSFLGHFLGKKERLLGILKNRLGILGLREEDCIETSYIKGNVFWAEFRQGTPIEVLLDRSLFGGKSSKIKSDYVKKPISKQGLEFIWKKLIEVEKIFMQWTPYGGKMDDIPDWKTPYTHRKGNLFRIAYIRTWREKGKDIAEQNINLVRDFYETMTPFVSRFPREVLYNYRDLDIGCNPSNYTDFDNALVYGSKYYKENFARLVRAKSEADPMNFFKNEQSIPPQPFY